MGCQVHGHSQWNSCRDCKYFKAIYSSLMRRYGMDMHIEYRLKYQVCVLYNFWMTLEVEALTSSRVIEASVYQAASSSDILGPVM